MSSIRIGEGNAGLSFLTFGATAPAIEAPHSGSVHRHTRSVGRVLDSQPAASRPRRKNLRRLRGFVIEDQGREFKVGFVEDGEHEKVTLYYLPSDLFRHAGVTAENQQFELDEIISKYRDGSVALTYHVR